MKRLIPFAIFLILAGFLAVGLQLNPREVPSPLIGRPAPAFTLPLLSDPAKTLSTTDLRGQAWLLNVWASWCASCRQEHEILLDLARRGVAPVYGLDYKDQPDAARAWLARLGNPYTAVIVDAEGRTGIDYGVYGVPETYVIDKQGVIRHKHTGPLTAQSVKEKILPLIGELQR